MAKPGMGVTKKKKKKKSQPPKQPPASWITPSLATFGLYYDTAGGYFGHDEDEDEDEDDGTGYCDRCHQRDYIDPHSGFCDICAEEVRPPGGCPCWRQTCAYDSDECMFECEF